MARIDLNADLGERTDPGGRVADAALLDLISSANVACGFHAGDPGTMRATVAAAAARGVVVGAHPGYPDPMGFGRRDLAATPEECGTYVLYQVGALAAVCRAHDTPLRHVKPHGALYHRAARDRGVADAIAGAIRAVDPSLVLLGLAGSELLAAAGRTGLMGAAEAFIDRAYEPDGTLTPRAHPEALIHDPLRCADRAARMVLDGIVVARDGTVLEVAPASLCVHGDGPAAAEVLAAVRARLVAAGVTIAPFTP